jgi:hypothetical protein
MKSLHGTRRRARQGDDNDLLLQLREQLGADVADRLLSALLDQALLTLAKARVQIDPDNKVALAWIACAKAARASS